METSKRNIVPQQLLQRTLGSAETGNGLQAAHDVNRGHIIDKAV